MPQFALSTTLLTDVGSILTGSHYWSPELNKGNSGLFQMFGNVNSFNAVLQGTLFFDPGAQTGSSWLNIGSVMTGPGAFSIGDGIKYGAYRVDVRSCASGTILNAAMTY